MMAARRADEREIKRVPEVARQYGDLGRPELKPAEYERQDYGRQQPELRAPETGKTYQGPIVSADDKYVVQSVREAGRELHIQHERLVLNSDRRELLNAGANVEIRYPYNRVGVVRTGQCRLAPCSGPPGMGPCPKRRRRPALQAPQDSTRPIGFPTVC